MLCRVWRNTGSNLFCHRGRRFSRAPAVLVVRYTESGRGNGIQAQAFRLIGGETDPVGIMRPVEDAVEDTLVERSERDRCHRLRTPGICVTRVGILSSGMILCRFRKCAVRCGKA